MSLSEQQIRAIVKDELRKIIDAGLMYTATCQPQEQPFDKLPQLHNPTPDVLSKVKPETAANTTIQADGSIAVTEFIRDRELWARINDDLKSLGYKWVRNEKDAKLSRWEKQQ